MRSFSSAKTSGLKYQSAGKVVDDAASSLKPAIPLSAVLSNDDLFNILFMIALPAAAYLSDIRRARAMPKIDAIDQIF
jgi:hypothetical protein